VPAAALGLSISPAVAGAMPARPQQAYEVPPMERPPMLFLDDFVVPGHKVVVTGSMTPLKAIHP